MTENQTVEKGRFIQTYRGNQFWLTHPRPEQINIHDIAHHLSLICRFNGACRSFYSVAQHSYLVSKYIRPKHALAGLLHDASEAYLGDCVTPLKEMLPEFRTIEENVQDVIYKRFAIKLTPSLYSDLRYTDQRVLVTEAKSLLTNVKLGDWDMDKIIPYEDDIDPWDPEMAKSVFMDQYRKLIGSQ